ncbi:MAG: peptide MFS transporter [Candidatus Omnitrophota bacterium]
MLKNHPKGLIIAFFTNMGERFGYYTMIAIFSLFVQAKYGLNAGQTGGFYSVFVMFVYFCPVLGGFLADKFLGYGRSISLGLIVMFLGYLLLAFPTPMGSGLTLVIVALLTIAFGTGFFKGNLQTLVGNMYDDPKYSAFRDSGFNIFYMGINIGAMFAPTAASLMTNWTLASRNFTYDARIPALAHDFLKGKLANAAEYLSFAKAQDANVTMDTLNQFSHNYVNALSRSYHFAFGLACISLIISMVVFWIFRKHYKHVDFNEKQKAKNEKTVELTPQQVKERLIALGLVFLVVIFFWMSFQQNGATMTYFARDYTVSQVGKLNYLWFDLFGLLSIFLSAIGLYFLVRKSSGGTAKILGGTGFVGFGLLAVFRYLGYKDINPFNPEMFQHFNPFFIVALTPLVVGFFAYLNKRGKEPSAPRKIGIGMLITAVSFAILAFASLKLASPKELGEKVAPTAMQVSTYWLISTYFLQTIAELFLSPMGISFVSRVAPPKYKGLMMGLWFASTAAGVLLISVIANLWRTLPLWQLWTIMVVCCLLSAIFIFSIMKRLEKVTQ